MDDLTPNNGHNDGGYDNNGYDNNGYNNGGYDNSGYNNNGYNNNGYNNGGYDNNGYNNGGYNNYGYGNNGGGYFPDGPFRGMYDEDNDFPEPQKGSGFAIASFVISLINLVICGTLLSIITVPLCLIFSVVSLAGRRKGAVFAVIGIIISLVSAVFFAFAGYIFYKITPDFIYFLNNAPQIIEEYDRDGSIPEQYEKYRDPKYDKYWERFGYNSFDEFFAKEFIEKNRAQVKEYSSSDTGTSASISSGFAPALIE
ncbi:MAG: DUF4190 domain-containing protein [Ruminococcus sp.]|nr:DUF4190 domain-containing protein [Ruminococcus sp.]